MKTIYAPCPNCLRVGTIPMLTDCTVEEAKDSLETSEDPKLVDTVFVFPCHICGKKYLPHTYDQLMSKLPKLLKNTKIVDKK